MTVVVPNPLPLDLPPGDPGALEDLVTDVAGAAAHLGAVGSALARASAPSWRGADASAAAARVAGVAGLAEELAAATSAAAYRLRRHHRLLAGARLRIATLREEQDEDFRHAWIRLAAIENPRLAAMIDSPERVAAIEELEAAEAARRREHARLMEELADDADGTARALADASVVVGGTGRRGDVERVTAHLAAALPGWGEAEARRRGQDMAQALTEGPVHPEEIDAVARRHLVHAGSAAFAEGLLTGLGVGGVRWLISILGHAVFGPSSAVAGVLAGALGAAVPAGRAADRVREVLTATYVSADGPNGYPDAIAAGLAAVLLARGPSGGVRPETAAGWARQLLLAERVLGASPSAWGTPAGWDSRAADPAALAFTVLAAGGNPAPAADLLSDREIWDTALGRHWADDGDVLSQVIALAGAESGSAGRAAVGAGLEALGAGLSEDGKPENWTVRRAIAASVAASLGGAVAGHVSVATDVLQAVVSGELRAADDDVLRGLAYLTLDRDAAATVGTALVGWMGEQPVALDGTSTGIPLPAVAVPAAYFAVQEYGQRLAYAMHGFEARAAAGTWKAGWDSTIGLLAELPPRHWGVAAGLVEGYLAIFFGADGTWENGRDSGLSFPRAAATRQVLAELGPEDSASSSALARQVAASYGRAAAALGNPQPPTSPVTDYTAPLQDAMVDLGVNRIEDVGRKGRSITGGR